MKLFAPLRFVRQSHDVLQVGIGGVLVIAAVVTWFGG